MAFTVACVGVDVGSDHLRRRVSDWLRLVLDPSQQYQSVLPFWLRRIVGVTNLPWPIGRRCPDLDEIEREVMEYGEEDRP